MVAAVCLVLGLLLLFHPSRPLLIRHVDMPVTVPLDGIRLAGTLSLPRWRSAPHPAVVIVHGSGRSVRSDMLTDVRRFIGKGFAVYTYDKRGVGESGGVFAEPSSQNSGVLRELAHHARAVYDAVCQRPEIDSTRVGFFGVSQAGWIIPLTTTLPTSSPSPKFAILLSGPAISTGIEERYSALTLDGRNPEAMSQMPRIRAEVDAYTGPAGYEPRSVLQRFRTPSLWILGERDLSVPTWATVRVLRELTDQFQLPITVVTYPDVGHDLRHFDGEPNPRVWADIDRFLTVADSLR